MLRNERFCEESGSWKFGDPAWTQLVSGCVDKTQNAVVVLWCHGICCGQNMQGITQQLCESQWSFLHLDHVILFVFHTLFMVSNSWISHCAFVNGGLKFLFAYS